ncbi:divergent PAP2 family protein [Helcococcus kunzii]|nr:divergent PAP2 family protein [Helcococcus kunzii]
MFFSITAWMIAQSMKVISLMLFKREFKPSLFFSSGGMPSAHSAFMASVSAQIGLISGFSSDVFALSCAITTVVVYDAYNVRRSVGLQGKALNKMIEYAKEDHDRPEIQTLKEVMGHTPLQVFCGVLLGIVYIIFLNTLGLIA